MLPAAYPTWKPQIQGLLVSGMIIGTVIAEFTCSGALSDYLIARLSSSTSFNSTANCPHSSLPARKPEIRLYLLVPALFTTTLGLILFAVSQQYHWHYIVAQLATALFAFGIQVANTVVSSYIVDCYPDQVMSIVALYSVHLNLSAFASPFWIVPQQASEGWGWAFGSEAIIVAGCAVVWVPAMIIWGGRMLKWRGPLVLESKRDQTRTLENRKE